MEGLLKKISVGITLAALTLVSFGGSGCGSNCKLQIGNGLPAKRPVYGFMREDYDQKMDRLKWGYQEEMRIQRIITPSNDSVNGYLPLPIRVGF